MQKYISDPNICTKNNDGIEGYEDIKMLCKKQHVYGTHNVKDPIRNPVLKDGVPYLDRLAQISSYGHEPSSVLWVSMNLCIYTYVSIYQSINLSICRV